MHLCPAVCWVMVHGQGLNKWRSQRVQMLQPLSVSRAAGEVRAMLTALIHVPAPAAQQMVVFSS